MAALQKPSDAAEVDSNMADLELSTAVDEAAIGLSDLVVEELDDDDVSNDNNTHYRPYETEEPPTAPPSIVPSDTEDSGSDLEAGLVRRMSQLSQEINEQSGPPLQRKRRRSSHENPARCKLLRHEREGSVRSVADWNGAVTRPQDDIAVTEG